MLDKVEVRTARELTNSDYHAHSAFSSTFVKTLVKQGLHKAVWQKSHPAEPTPALTIGRLTHELILEDLHSFCAPPEGVNLLTKAGRDWKADKKARGIEVMRADQVRDIYNMRDAVERHAEASDWLNASREREVSAFVQVDGVPWKARFDAVNSTNLRDVSHIVDLKTCASLEQFETDFFKKGYDVQADWYRLPWRDTEAVPVFVFIAVEKSAPHRVRVYTRATISTDFRQILQVLRGLESFDGVHDLPVLPAKTFEGQPRLWEQTVRDETLSDALRLVGVEGEGVLQ